MSTDGGPFEFTPEERGFERVGEGEYSGGMKQDATREEYEIKYEVRSAGDKYYPQKLWITESGQVGQKETLGRSRQSREDAVETVQRRVRNTTAPGFGGFEIGDFVVGSEGDITMARAAHRGRSERAQTIDEQRRARVTTDASRYAKRPGELDYPAVDTPSTDPNVLPKDLKQSQRPDTTDPDEETEIATGGSKFGAAASGKGAFWLNTSDERLPASEFSTSPEGEPEMRERRRAQLEIAQRDVPASSEEIFGNAAQTGMTALGGYDPREGGEIDKRIQDRNALTKPRGGFGGTFASEEEQRRAFVTAEMERADIDPMFSSAEQTALERDTPDVKDIPALAGLD